ncbi:hypothetical protein DK26_11220 [Bosea sp. WAO]|uniref:hypothetical protein n=1 Tax=Bosea sp. WAO TaxID=406341 RepID=UPI000747639D|nr:hypothetical protein [Bosea sp. WAO]KUL95653.1 hypothetical protein DK26_11220 [Bosea sp. WAO]
MAETRMPKPMRLLGACALAAAVLFIVAQHASAPFGAFLAATTTEMMSPLDIMTIQDKPLPLDEWDAS